MNLTNEQIEQILDGAPEGMSQARARHELRGGVCYSNSPHGDEPINLNHALSDLREILALRKRVQELEAQNAKLLPLAYRCLWGAFVWNDHNFDHLQDVCKNVAARHGINSFDEANEFLGEVADYTPKGE